MTAHHQPRAFALPAFLFLLLIVNPRLIWAQRELAIVKAGPLSVFADMSAKGDVVTTLSPGKSVLITFSATNAEGKWCAVSDADGSKKLGFVRCDGLERSSASVATFSASEDETQIVDSGMKYPVTSTAEENELRKRWSKMFDDRSWNDLDALAEKLRKGRLRFQGGGWQLHVLYCIIGAGCLTSKRDSDWESHIAALQEWMRIAPSSPTPRIALADAYDRFAWKARGSGFVDTVTPEGWSLFNKRVEMARQVLEESRDFGSTDPEWYHAMIRVAINQGWNRAQVEAVVDEALRKEPGYFYDVREMAEYLLPKWYGTPGDTEQFVGAAADNIGGAEGDATYFFFAEILLVDEGLCLNCLPPAISWTRIRRGYAAIERLYGINNYELNALAFLALHAGDFQTARQVFKEIGDNWDPDVWPSRHILIVAASFHITRRCPSLPQERRTWLNNDAGTKGSIRFRTTSIWCGRNDRIPKRQSRLSDSDPAEDESVTTVWLYEWQL